jgi:hypothetical protein
MSLIAALTRLWARWWSAHGRTLPPARLLGRLRTFDAAPTTPWALDDQRWFAANPDRRYRLRTPIANELKESPKIAKLVPPEAAGLAVICVHRLEDGRRVRVPIFRLFKNPPMETGEEAARYLFETSPVKE